MIVNSNVRGMELATFWTTPADRRLLYTPILQI
jgi:hypothetical protein